MALYMLHVYTRKTGATKKMSYNFRENEYKNRKNENLLLKESYNLPDWSKNNSQTFWEAVDNYETRSNATKIRCIDFSLPREFSTEENISIARKYSNELLGKDYVYSISIHEKINPDGTKNPHVHLMFSERKLDEIKRSPEVFFKQANKYNPEKGGARKERSWWKKKTLYNIRESWENTLNKELEKKGIEKVFSKSLRKMKETERELGNIDKAEFFDREPINISKEILNFKDKTKLNKHALKKLKVFELSKEIKELKKEKLCILEKNNLIKIKQAVNSNSFEESAINKDFKNSSLLEKVEIALDLEIKLRYNKFKEKDCSEKINSLSGKEDEKSLVMSMKYKEKLETIQEKIIELNVYQIQNINSRFFNVLTYPEELKIIQKNSEENIKILESRVMPINEKIEKIKVENNNIKNPDFIKLRMEQDLFNSKIRIEKIKIVIISSKLNIKVKNKNSSLIKKISDKIPNKTDPNGKVASSGFKFKLKKRKEKGGIS